MGSTDERIKYRAGEELLELKGEVQILRDKEKTLKREVERYKDTTRALEEALEEAVKSNGGKQYTPKKDQGHALSLEDGEDGEDNDELVYNRNPQTEGLISEIVALKKKIKELEGGRHDIEEETKDTHHQKGDSLEVIIENILRSLILPLGGGRIIG